LIPDGFPFRDPHCPDKVWSGRFRAGRPLRDGFETMDRPDTRQERLLFRPSVSDFDVAFAFADLVPFHDVVRGYDVTSLGIDLLEVDAIAGPFG
jgi:hypothetical protein